MVIDAKRPEVYAQLFDPGLAETGAGACLAPAALAARLAGRSWLLAGDGVAQVLPHLGDRTRDMRVAAGPGLCDAAEVAALAASEPLPEAGCAPPQPIYLRVPDVTPAVEQG